MNAKTANDPKHEEMQKKVHSVLAQLDGMSIREAEELLHSCVDLLMQTPIVGGACAAGKQTGGMLDGLPKVAVPQKAAEVLTSIGYPTTARNLREWAKEGKIAATDVGSCLRVSVASVIEYYESSKKAPKAALEKGGIRKLDIDIA